VLLLTASTGYEIPGLALTVTFWQRWCCERDTSPAKVEEMWN